MTDTDYDLSLLALIESGSSREVAEATLAAFPSLTGQLAPQKRAEIEGQIVEREARRQADSPEARRVALLEADAEAQEDAALAEASRRALVREGYLSAEEAAGLSDQEANWTSGVVEKPYAAMNMAEADAAAEAMIADGSYARLPVHERIRVAGDLNGTLKSFDAAAARLGQTVAKSGKPESEGGES